MGWLLLHAEAGNYEFIDCRYGSLTATNLSKSKRKN
jgi:hypothetical protein